MSIDVDGLLRRRKPEKRTARLEPRALSELVGVEAVAFRPGASRLVPDTTVYIDLAAGRAPAPVRDLYARSVALHCSVSLAEITAGLGACDPRHPATPARMAYFTALFATIPENRVLTPDVDVWTDAGLVSGVLARTQGFAREARRACFNDALIYLSAAKAGVAVLTRNRVDFDLIQQVAPAGAFIHY